MKKLFECEWPITRWWWWGMKKDSAHSNSLRSSIQENFSVCKVGGLHFHIWISKQGRVKQIWNSAWVAWELGLENSNIVIDFAWVYNFCENHATSLFKVFKNVERVCFYETSLLVISLAFAHHKETLSWRICKCINLTNIDFFAGCSKNYWK